MLDSLLAVGAVVLVLAVVALWVNRPQVDAASPAGSQRLTGAPADPGNYVFTRVGADGRLRSDQYIVSDEPVQSVTMHVRPLAGYDNVVPVVSVRQVSSDGQPVDDTEKVRLAGSAARDIDLGASTTTVHLRYVTQGAVIRSVPSRSGEALVFVNPLVVKADTAVERDVVKLEGARVLSFACVNRQLPKPCGQPDDAAQGRVRLERPAGVLAQVDL